MANKRVSVPAVSVIGLLVVALAILLLVLTDPWTTPDHANAADNQGYDKQAAKAQVKDLSNKFAAAVKNNRKTISLLSQAKKLVEKYDDLVSARILIAQILMRSGRLESAARHLEKAVALAPNQPKVRTLLGAVSEKLGDMDAARSQLSQATSLAPNDAKVRLKLANAQLKAGDMDKARQTALAALALNSQLHQAHVLLSEVYERQGKPSLAQSQMARALEMVSDKEHQTKVTYTRRRAKLLRRANRPEDALSVLRELSPRDLFAFPVSRDVARTFAMMGQPLLAAQHYATVLNLDPGNARAARLATHWYLKGHSVKPARQMLRKFSELSPNSKALTQLRKAVQDAANKPTPD